MKRKRKDVDKIPTDWKLVLILLGFGAFPFILNFCFSVLGLSYSKTRAVTHGEATLLVYFILGLIFLVSHTFDETGITSRYLGIPVRKIKWTQIEKIVIINDGTHCSTMLVLQGCPKPNFEKGKKYDMDFAQWHLWKAPTFSHSEKHIHLFEKYWHGEIENKALLYMKKA